MYPPGLQWIFYKSCTRGYDAWFIRISCAQVRELRQSHKAIVVVTVKTHCFHENIYIMLFLLL